MTYSELLTDAHGTCTVLNGHPIYSISVSTDITGFEISHRSYIVLE